MAAALAERPPSGSTVLEPPDRDGTADANRRVYFLARKALVQNSRIFKQAKSLADAGYEVTIFGIGARIAPEREERDGYTILRLHLRPMWAEAPHAVRRSLRSVELAVSRALRRRYRRLASLGRRMSLMARRGIRRIRRVPLVRPLVDAVRRRVARQSKKPPVLRRRFTPDLASVGRLISAPAVVIRRLLAKAVRTFNNGITRLIRFLLDTFRRPLVSAYYYRRVHELVSGMPPPAVVHANDLDTLLIGVVLARRYRVPLVYDAQELYTGIHTLPSWYRLLLTIQERVLIRRADRVIAVNDAIAETMEKSTRRKVDAVVLNCPSYEAAPRAARSPTIRERFEIPAETPIFLYSGGFTRQRGIENTVLALKHLPYGVLVLLGDGALKDDLVALVEREKLGERVYFSGYVLHHEVARFISSADVGVIPYQNVSINHYLCSPSKLFHYVMAELPIACSDFPFLRSVVVDNKLGTVFDPANPASIADAIASIVEDEEEYSRRRARLAQVKRRYAWDEEEKRFLTVYRSLANAEPGKALSVR